MSKTSLKSSIKVLLTLHVMLDQDYQALVYYSENLEEDYIDKTKYNIPLKDEIIDSTIIDSLWFQIIIKSCSFIDEWDRFLGVKNESEYIEKLRIIKSVASPARKAIGFWKELKKFRNEITAHNFRDKEHVVKIDDIGKYDCPQNLRELFFLIAFISRLINILCKNFQEEIPEIIHSFSEVVKSTNNNEDSNLKSDEKFEKLKNLLIKVDEDISERIWNIPRYDIRNEINKGLNG